MNLWQAYMLGVMTALTPSLLVLGLILWRTMELLGFESVTISTRGLRYGMLMGN